MQVFMLVPIISKLLAMFFKTTFGFILTLQHSFHAVLGDNFGFLPRPDKFSVGLNYLNFFIMDCTVDISSVVNISWLVEVTKSLSQVSTKLLCLPHHVVNVKMTLFFAKIIMNIWLNKYSQRLHWSNWFKTAFFTM